MSDERTVKSDDYRLAELFRCSERAYPANKFYNRVAYYPFDDHSAPTLPLMTAFCVDVVIQSELY
jgi:phosphatidylinositol-3,4,5-trisphosphate 3-phosphatase/dual-specificity protein phosphatase PTEN